MHQALLSPFVLYNDDVSIACAGEGTQLTLVIEQVIHVSDLVIEQVIHVSDLVIEQVIQSADGILHPDRGSTDVSTIEEKFV